MLDVDLDDARAAAKTFGGSLNDFFVTGAAGGAGAYHQCARCADRQPRAWRCPSAPARTSPRAATLSCPPERSCPWAAIPGERFEAIHTQLDQTKHERVLGLVDQLAGVLNLLPTSVLARFTLEQARTVDFTTSNVRAAPFDLFIAGALIEATYPLGPLGSTAFNLTMMSYRGELNMGLHMDTGAIRRTRFAAGCLEEAYAELIAAAR